MPSLRRRSCPQESPRHPLIRNKRGRGLLFCFIAYRAFVLMAWSGEFELVQVALKVNHHYTSNQWATSDKRSCKLILQCTTPAANTPACSKHLHGGDGLLVYLAGKAVQPSLSKHAHYFGGPPLQGGMLQGWQVSVKRKREKCCTTKRGLKQCFHMQVAFSSGGHLTERHKRGKITPDSINRRKEHVLCSS